MVRDQHDVPGGEGGVHRPGGVGHHQRLRPQQARKADGIRRLLHGPALIGVEPALHHSHVLAAEAAEDKLPPVVRRGGAPHMGNLTVGDHNGGFHLVSQKAQAGAQNQQHPGTEVPQTGLQGTGTLPVPGIVQGGAHSFPPHSRQKASSSRTTAPQVGQTGIAGVRPRASLMSASWALSSSISRSLASSSSDSVGVPVWVA